MTAKATRPDIMPPTRTLGVALVVGISMLALVTPADAFALDFHARANQLCTTILGMIKDPPQRMHSPSQLPRPVGDRWLASASGAFAALSGGLDDLEPPPRVRLTYRRMTDRFAVLGRLFATAKRDFDRGHYKALDHQLSVAAEVAGRAAALATMIDLAECGP